MNEKLKEDKSELDQGFEKGYKSGRTYYKNDIHMEVANVGTAIDILERYESEETELIERLKHTKGVLEVLLETKAKSNKFLNF